MAIVVSVVVTLFNLIFVFVGVLVVVIRTFFLTMERGPPDILRHLVNILRIMLPLFGDLMLSIIVILL